VQALAGLDLEVEPGSVFGFLGPNGAGKTTTLRILAGLARADAGQAWIDGLEVAGARSRVASRIGYLPQDPAFYPWMKAWEFLDHVGRVFGLPAQERQARTRELLHLVGLVEVAHRRVGGFSGGMGQRLGIAQALVNRPPVLLLDEPVSGLDPAGRRELLHLIDQLRGQCTVFMSTHILADVERVCDTVAIIDRGRLLAEAPQQELLGRYAVPAIEIEVGNGLAAQLLAWTETLRSRPWMVSVSLERTIARVAVDDLDLARREILASALAAGLVLDRYEMVRPSLEDVFLRLVEGGGQA
jgi:ABC-2 type transport system ATP-binding protein